MATTKFRLSSKADKVTGQCEVLVRFFHGRIDQYAKTNIFVDPERWNAKGERVTIPKIRVMSPEAQQLTAELSDINARLEKMKQHINDSFMEAGAGKVQLPGSWLADLLQEFNFPTVPESRGVLDMLARFTDQRVVSKSNINHGRAVFRAFKRFLIYSGSPELETDQVTPDTLRDFVDYLRKEHTFFEVKTDDNGTAKVVFLNSSFKDAFQAVPESRLPVERGQNAINKFLEQLRTFYIWANNNDLTNNNPFRKYQVPQYLYGTPYYITVEERNQLWNHDFSDNPRLEVQRDIFVFQCVIGCRVSDLRNLTKGSIINGAVEYIPRKTKEGRPVTVRVPLNSVARAILEKYKDIPGDKLLPCIADQNYNYAIKEVFQVAGLTRPVTILNPTTRQEEKRPLNEVASSHLARRCFIGNLYKQVKDPNLIGKLSGHVEGSKAFARYRDIDEEMRMELVTMLE
jgi:integrase